MQVMQSSDFRNRCQILSTFSDEAHFVSRSPTSAQNSSLREITTNSRFNVLITGTLFPLGPSTDANEFLISLGGPFDNRGRWSRKLARSFDHLFDTPEKISTFPVLALRVLIAPFTLRRTASSTWMDQPIINRAIARPVPRLLLPFGDEKSEVQATERFKSTKKKESLFKLQMRADNQRWSTWSPLYVTYLAKRSSNTGTNVRLIEKIVQQGMPENEKDKWAMSGRLKRLISWVKAVRKLGERFIIVTDRVFPIVLCHWVYLNNSHSHSSRF